MRQDSQAFDALRFSILELTKVGQEYRKRGGVGQPVVSVEKIRKMSSCLDVL